MCDHSGRLGRWLTVPKWPVAPVGGIGPRDCPAADSDAPRSRQFTPPSRRFGLRSFSSGRLRPIPGCRGMSNQAVVFAGVWLEDHFESLQHRSVQSWTVNPQNCAWPRPKRHACTCVLSAWNSRFAVTVHFKCRRVLENPLPLGRFKTGQWTWLSPDSSLSFPDWIKRARSGGGIHSPPRAMPVKSRLKFRSTASRKASLHRKPGHHGPDARNKAH